MAISFSPRVRRNLAQQMAFSHRWSGSAGNRYAVQCLLLISNEVAIPSDPSQLFNYLNTCLNNSANDGTGGADLEIADKNIVAGQQYKSFGFNFYVPSINTVI